MYESEDYQCLVKEDDDENHISTLNKSSLQLHRHSLQKSNHTSQIALENVWEWNSKLFTETAVDTVVASANALLQGCDANNTARWNTGLHKYLSSDKELHDIFKSTIHPCEMCSANQKQDTKNWDKHFNNECICELNLVDPSSDNRNGDKKNSINSLTDSNQDCTIEKIFQPKGRTKAIKTTSKSLHNQEIDLTKPERRSYYEEGNPFEKRTSFNQEKTYEFEERTSNLKERNNQFEKKNPTEIDFEKIEEENRAHKSNVAKITFKTAKQQLLATNPAAKRTLGATRKAQAKFVSPMIGSQDNKQETCESAVSDDRLKHIDPKMVELIESEIIDKGTPIGWDDIAGLSAAKGVLQEAVVWPLLRPDMFTGLRRPPKGVLLFGPPGTGKTLIGKCVASQCNATFFSISASSLTSKWIGDGEKMVRALFAVARCYQPAVIFIDEIDSLLTQRSDTEHEATRRIKTEFLVQFDGANTAEEDRILVVGATNRPQSLDEAARRRLVKRLYIPLPDLQAREQIITNLLKTESNDLSPDEVSEVARLTEGYSGADMKSLCSEAAMGPIRAVPLELIVTIQRDKVRPVNLSDFMSALQRVRPSVSQADLGQYEQWNRTYGHGL